MVGWPGQLLLSGRRSRKRLRHNVIRSLLSLRDPDNRRCPGHPGPPLSPNCVTPFPFRSPAGLPAGYRITCLQVSSGDRGGVSTDSDPGEPGFTRRTERDETGSGEEFAAERLEPGEEGLGGLVGAEEAAVGVEVGLGVARLRQVTDRTNGLATARASQRRGPGGLRASSGRPGHCAVSTRTDGSARGSGACTTGSHPEVERQVQQGVEVEQLREVEEVAEVAARGE